MAKTLTISVQNWQKLQYKLKEQYKNKPSVMLISSVMRQELGFTVRQHSTWEDDSNFGKYPVAVICLDFYDDQLETLFRLKYLEYCYD